MSPRLFATMAGALCETVILVGWIIAAVAGLGLADVKNTHAKDRATEMGEAGLSNTVAVSAGAAVLIRARTASHASRHPDSRAL